jgi:uncharacterized membrane protein YccF (DUF307 family)
MCLANAPEASRGWSLSYTVWMVLAGVVVLPAHLLAMTLCWLSILMIPMAKVSHLFSSRASARNVPLLPDTSSAESHGAWSDL